MVLFGGLILLLILAGVGTIFKQPKEEATTGRL
jgi:hypothetical protein